MAKAKCPWWSITLVKWMDYLAGICFLWTGIAICVMMMVSPTMIMSPPFPIIIGISLLCGTALKIMSSMVIQVGLHDTWGLFVSSLIYTIIFAALAFVALRSQIGMIFSLLNPEKIAQIAACLGEEGAMSLADRATNIANKQVDAVAGNVIQSAAPLVQQANAVQQAAAQTGAQVASAQQGLVQQANAVQQAAAQTSAQVAATPQVLAQPIR